jgi:endonuclease/exonuclease/phosphatase family metal-dependent hydrolase
MLSRSLLVSYLGGESCSSSAVLGCSQPALAKFRMTSPQTGRLLPNAAPGDIQPEPMGQGYAFDEGDVLALSRPVLRAQPAETLRLIRPFRTLMSYNVQDFYRTHKNKQVKSPEAIDALAEVIEKENADVIALQEVGDKGILKQFNLKHLKGRYPNIVSSPVWARSQHQLAFLSKGNIRIVETRSHWKEFCRLSHGAAVRDLLEATFETDTGYQFTVFNVHLKSMQGREEKTAPVRLKESIAAARIIHRHCKEHPDAHVFITGDLNTHYDTEDGRPVIENLERLGELDKEPVFSEVMLKDHLQEPTNRAVGFPDSKLDYTFSSKALTPLVREAYVAGDFDQEPWRKASDHLPLVTVFEEGKPLKKPGFVSSEGPACSGRKPQAAQQSKKSKLELLA